jgi:hypothetical protein
MHPAFQYSTYRLKRQVFAMTGVFRLFSENGDLLAYARQKMFKMREDIRLYNDETQTQELLSIQARQIIDFSAAYDVFDSTTQEFVGTLRRRGWRSMMRDEWELLDAQGMVFGKMQEDSAQRALLRRLLLGAWLPQRYDISIGDTLSAEFDQEFNLLRYELVLDFKPGLSRPLDRRLGIAAAILLAAIEGRQE